MYFSAEQKYFCWKIILPASCEQRTPIATLKIRPWHNKPVMMRHTKFQQGDLSPVSRSHIASLFFGEEWAAVDTGRERVNEQNDLELLRSASPAALSVLLRIDRELDPAGAQRGLEQFLRGMHKCEGVFRCRRVTSPRIPFAGWVLLDTELRLQRTIRS